MEFLCTLALLDVIQTQTCITNNIEPHHLILRNESIHKVLSTQNYTHLYLESSNSMIFQAGLQIYNNEKMNALQTHPHPKLTKIKSLVYPLSIMTHMWSYGFPAKGTLYTVYDLTDLYKLKYLSVWSPYTCFTNKYNLTEAKGGKYYYQIIEIEFRKPTEYLNIIPMNGTFQFIFQTRHPILLTFLTDQEHREFVYHHVQK